jgi:hypothetical protein
MDHYELNANYSRRANSVHAKKRTALKIPLHLLLRRSPPRKDTLCGPQSTIAPLRPLSKSESLHLRLYLNQIPIRIDHKDQRLIHRG